jgi:hypothetical protein
VRRDRPIVDDASSARRLRLHDADRLLRAEERAIRFVSTTAFHFSNGRSSIGIGGVPMPALFEQKIEPTEPLPGLRKQRVNRGGIGHVGRHRQTPGADSPEHLIAASEARRGGRQTRRCNRLPRGERHPLPIAGAAPVTMATLFVFIGGEHDGWFSIRADVATAHARSC